jgi:hypothetical protein
MAPPHVRRGCGLSGRLSGATSGDAARTSAYATTRGADDEAVPKLEESACEEIGGGCEAR